MFFLEIMGKNKKFVLRMLKAEEAEKGEAFIQSIVAC